MKEQFYRALKLKYEAEVMYYQTALQIYFTQPVAICEHAQHLELMDKLLEKIASTTVKLDALKSFMIMLDSPI